MIYFWPTLECKPKHLTAKDEYILANTTLIYLESITVKRKQLQQL